MEVGEGVCVCVCVWQDGGLYVGAGVQSDCVVHVIMRKSTESTNMIE